MQSSYSIEKKNKLQLVKKLEYMSHELEESALEDASDEEHGNHRLEKTSDQEI